MKATSTSPATTVVGILCACAYENQIDSPPSILLRTKPFPLLLPQLWSEFCVLARVRIRRGVVPKLEAEDWFRTLPSEAGGKSRFGNRWRAAAITIPNSRSRRAETIRTHIPPVYRLAQKPYSYSQKDHHPSVSQREGNN